MGYEEDFSLYLKFTNEKEILSKEILNLFKKFKVKSVLDIGAGNGDLSKFLADKVERYLAVEQKKKFVECLKDKKIEVIEGNFPCDTGKEKFDFILCSHSVPYTSQDYVSFLKSAFEKLNKNGLFLIITYIGEGDDWNNFLESIGIKPFENTLVSYLERKKFLEQFGELTEWFVTSKVETSSIEDLMKALSFVASGGKEDKRDIFFSKEREISNILKTKYFDVHSKKHFFPFKHVFLMVNKK